jgi:hypothetical protein
MQALIIYTLGMILTAVAITAWVQYMTVKDLNRIKRHLNRRKHLNRYKAHLIYKGTDRE